MKKPEAEKLVRNLVHIWAQEIGFKPESGEMPMFYQFKNWLLERHPDALSFRSVLGPQDAAEQWFDEELNQTWRN